MDLSVEFADPKPALSTEAGSHTATTEYGTDPFPHT